MYLDYSPSVLDTNGEALKLPDIENPFGFEQALTVLAPSAIAVGSAALLALVLLALTRK